MKNHLLALLASVTVISAQDTIPALPIGALNATPRVVQTGTYPTLNWFIVHPSNIKNVATITPPGQITLNKESYVSIRPVYVSNNKASEARLSINNENYKQLFYGTNQDIDPTRDLYTKQLPAGTKINVGGRFVEDGTWSPFYTSKSTNARVVTLANGQKFKGVTIQDEVRPYVNSNGTVKVGPMSALVVMELESTNQYSDYQDVVILISLSEKNNNGHGNNLDGVDSSNPGGGHGGPNGEVDPSAGVDDEK